MIIFRDQSQSTQTSQVDRLNSKRSNLVLPLHRKVIERTTSSNVSDSVRISVADTPEKERSVTFSSWDEGSAWSKKSEKKSLVIDMSDDGIDIGQSKDQTGWEAFPAYFIIRLYEHQNLKCTPVHV